MPWLTLCGFPPVQETVSLIVPNGKWRSDTVITDTDGNEYFVLLEVENKMRSYEAIFADLDGNKLCCVKRHVMKAFWRDGFYFCTYQKNYPGQRALADRDADNKKVYPFSYLEVNPMKGIFQYRLFDDTETLQKPKMIAQNGWLGFMAVCCTPLIRCGNWTAQFLKARGRPTKLVEVDQWRNTLDVGPGNDLLAALCMAYVFDKFQCQPFVTLFGDDEDEMEEEGSFNSDDEIIGMNNVPRQEPRKQQRQAPHDEMEPFEDRDLEPQEFGYDGDSHYGPGDDGYSQDRSRAALPAANVPHEGALGDYDSYYDQGYGDDGYSYYTNDNTATAAGGGGYLLGDDGQNAAGGGESVASSRRPRIADAQQQQQVGGGGGGGYYTDQYDDYISHDGRPAYQQGSEQLVDVSEPLGLDEDASIDSRGRRRPVTQPPPDAYGRQLEPTEII